jgi:lysophospholipase L1-like esterase
MQLEFTVTNQELSRIDTQKIVANSKGYCRAHVNFPTNYTGTITLNIKRLVDGVWTNTSYDVDKTTGLTNYLDDVLTDKAGREFDMYVWLSSTDTDIYIPTNQKIIPVKPSGDTLIVLPQIDKSINQYEETVRLHTEVVQKAEEVNDATINQPYIGENKNWFIWSNGEYIDSGFSSVGGDGYTDIEPSLSGNLFIPEQQVLPNIIPSNVLYKGVLTSFPGYYISSKIPIDKSADFYKYVNQSMPGADYIGAQFDANDNLLEYLTLTSTFPIFFPNSDASYVRFTINDVSDNAQIFLYQGYKGKYPKMQGIFYDKIGIFLGDSITRGLGVPAEKSYPMKIMSRLGLKKIYNYGMDGSTVADGSNPMYIRYASMSDEADFIVVTGGTNDSAYETPIGTINDTTGATFYGAWNILLEGLTSKYPGKPIFVFTPTSTKREHIDAIIDVSIKYNKPCFNWGGSSNMYGNAYLFTLDGTHYTEAYTDLFAKKLTNFINMQ